MNEDKNKYLFLAGLAFLVVAIGLMVECSG